MNNPRYFTGIGSRSTPLPILEKMQEIARFLASKGYTLRSGGASGADKDGFEAGCDSVGGKKEIYLPWLGFNNSESKLLWTKPDWDIAEKFHPRWEYLKLGAKQLMARNTCQLGINAEIMSEFVVCWTEGGKEVGGTAQALRIAREYKIPIFNLGDKTGLTKLRKWCKVNLK
jgi:hypothetical protein